MSYSRNLVVALVMCCTSAAYAQSTPPKLSAKARAAAEAEAYAQVKAEAYAAAKAQAEADAKVAAESAARARAEAEAAALVLAKQEAETKAEEELKERGKQLVLDEMSDPDSTKFRKVFVSTSRKAVCGEVNSKNRQGGYNGFSPFFAVLSTGGVGVLDSYLEKFRAMNLDTSDFVRVYNHNCK
jgi:hypothetical protein